VVVYGSDEFISIAAIGVQVSEKMSDILAPETPVTTASNTVGSDYPAVTPPPDCVTVDMKETRYLSNSEHRAHLIFMYHNLFLLYLNLLILRILQPSCSNNHPDILI
jgi:hypothetical protein